MRRARLAAGSRAEAPSSCDVCRHRLECSIYEELCVLALRGCGYVGVEDAMRVGVPREAIEGLPQYDGCVHVEDLFPRLPRLCGRWRNEAG